jgi:AcrR family transcriptional regulator
LTLCHFVIAVLPSTKRARTRDQLLVSAQTLLMDSHVAALGLRRITDHAGLVHASFYTHFHDIAALVTDLGQLMAATHAAATASLVSGLDDPAIRFARITRYTLQIVCRQPAVGHLLFDAGLPVDGLAGELRWQLRLDLASGTKLGIFAMADLDLATSMVTGAIVGLALDLYRGALTPDAIDAATRRLLIQIGLDADEAQRLGHEPVTFPPPPDFPMRWLALQSRSVGNLR